jgi:hypothetical protein
MACYGDSFTFTLYCHLSSLLNMALTAIARSFNIAKGLTECADWLDHESDPSSHALTFYLFPMHLNVIFVLLSLSYK